MWNLVNFKNTYIAEHLWWLLLISTKWVNETYRLNFKQENAMRWRLSFNLKISIFSEGYIEELYVYFKEIKPLKSLQKAEAYLKP